MSAATIDPVETVRATLTPALFARTASNRVWTLAPHLRYLDRALSDAVTTNRKRLIVMMPPRHGKSELCSKYLPAWYLGTFPDHRVMLGSYEADFAASWGRKARELLDTHGWMFGVSVSKASSAANRWDLAGHAGGMQTAGVGGPFTGKGANLLIIDDPIKGHEEANSPVQREKVWDWWRANAYTRLEPGAIVVVIQTRWHEEDLAGRILANAQETGEPWTLIRFPALAEEDDPLGREVDEPLWPERFSKEHLLHTRTVQGTYWWSAMYQQRPVPLEGGMFKREWFAVVPGLPGEIKRAIRGWDKAGTAGDGDYSAGVLLAEHQGTFYVVHVTRGQWSSGQRNDVMKATAAGDKVRPFKRLDIWVEQEPGSGGKESAEFTIKMLAGYTVRAERATGDKVTRWGPFAAQCEAGNVKLVRGPWNAAFLDELCAAPNGSHDDQIDAAALAFNKLARPPRIFAAGIA
jgi:predicted phage terminase large subunit-like protein